MCPNKHIFKLIIDSLVTVYVQQEIRVDQSLYIFLVLIITIALTHL